ncbi:hypothetical protein [Chlamydiifrater volucris]|uniref:hypothetical protein n=1 Tax=Chlamydiifrater volucris TaxID=2681470 RepID=UPI001BCBF3CA|nr:hypothetical protein [Chlamydiifrater volucris]
MDKKDYSKDPIVSKIKQAIETLKKYSKTSNSKSINTILSLESLKKIEELKKKLRKSLKPDSTSSSNKDKEKEVLSEMNVVKLSIRAIIAELQEIRELLEEAMDKDAIAHEDVVQAVMMDLMYKFLPLSGGSMKGDLFMNNYPIKGLKTPLSPEDSHAVNFGFLKTYLLPITNKFDSIEVKCNNHDLTLSSVQLQKMSVSGGSFKGNVNMDGNRLTGLPYPKKGSEAVSLEFLQKFAEAKMNPGKKDDKEKKTTATTNSPYVISSPSNTLYSGRVVDKNPSPLPLQLIGGGFNGFTWKKGDSDSEGAFPWESLRYSKMKDEEDNCFIIPEAKNGYELSGTRPGIYDWNFTLQALVPTSQQVSHPTIKLEITLNHGPWALANSQFSKTSTLPITLSLKAKTYVSGNSYNLVELSASNANSHRTIMVPPHYSGFSIKLRNNTTDHEESTDLYVIQAFYSLSWRGI